MTGRDKISTDLRQPCVVHTSSWDGMQEEDEIITFSMALKVLSLSSRNECSELICIESLELCVMLGTLSIWR